MDANVSAWIPARFARYMKQCFGGSAAAVTARLPHSTRPWEIFTSCFRTPELERRWFRAFIGYMIMFDGSVNWHEDNDNYNDNNGATPQISICLGRMYDRAWGVFLQDV